MVQWFQDYVAVQDPGSILITHMVAHNRPIHPVTPVPGDSLTSSASTEHACGAYMYVQAK